MLEVILKRFDVPEETRVFEKGKLDIVRIGGMTIGRASYELVWVELAGAHKSSLGALLQAAKTSCQQ